MVDAGVCLLGSSPAAVAVAADKWECSRRFAQAGPADAARPSRGAGRRRGRGGAARLPRGRQAARRRGLRRGLPGHGRRASADALRQPALRGPAPVLVQRYVEGTAASVSLLVADGRSTALSLNGQRVHAGIPFAYDGGVASMSHPRRAEACELAQRAVALVPGLQGYVGVDLVLGEETCWLIEINPAADDVVCGAAPRDRPQHGGGHLASVPGRYLAGRGGRAAGRGVRKGMGR